MPTTSRACPGAGLQTLLSASLMSVPTSGRIPGSQGHDAAKAKLASLDRRCVHLRKQASHQLTTMLADTYSEVVVENLDLAAMKEHGPSGIPAFCL